ncbi:DUF1801 domain-containing protein [Fulvivirga sp. 29W222]|uniref:DUF1801 domain-containing protein n=1 Tax=Fulvivirga marina TaxID=2494733 RepID=A0A937G2B0_9BACT|nr:DUF1801 domain-containing protein [Fulvivirga marina]MBL6448680.1 DUF1801 domain-containing protein [Fulvivirga marina]
MAELKTKLNEENVENFINSVKDEQRRRDSFKVLHLMKGITDTEPKMWGSSIIGFDHYHYKYNSGREGDWFITGFSPRKQALTLYIMAGFSKYEELLQKLGKYKTGKSCLYIKRLEDIDLNVLKELINSSVRYMRKKYY